MQDPEAKLMRVLQEIVQVLMKSHLVVKKLSHYIKKGLATNKAPIQAELRNVTDMVDISV